MKKQVIPIALSILSLSAYSQAWMKGGNNPSGNPFILGSNSNDPIGFETNGIQRSKLNANINYAVNGLAGAKDGYMLLGPDAILPGVGTLYNNLGAFSLLHLNGSATRAQELGYRTWMKTGITFTDNADRA